MVVQVKLLHHHLRCHLGKNDQDKLTMQTTSKVKGVDIGVVGIMAEDMEANMEEVITEEVEGVTMGVEEEIRIEGLFRMLDGKRIIKPKIMNANTLCLYLNNEFNGNEPETKDNRTYSRICPLIDHLVVDLVFVSCGICLKKPVFLDLLCIIEHTLLLRQRQRRSELIQQLILV